MNDCSSCVIDVQKKPQNGTAWMESYDNGDNLELTAMWCY